MGRAVLLDALGTLLRLHPPAPLLVEQLAQRGIAVSAEHAQDAMRAEMTYYRANHHVARDAASLQELRARCTNVLAEALPTEARAAGDLQDVLMASLRFEPFDEVPEVLRALRGAGARLVVVSNWDVSLHDVLARTGLAELVDGTVTSAEHGARKPDASIFAAALALASARPEDALHAGDDLEADVGGARAAGIEAVSVARAGAPAPAGGRAIRTLTELLDPGT
jgi:putative hydrolase of the HAD superfamily